MQYLSILNEESLTIAHFFLKASSIKAPQAKNDRFSKHIVVNLPVALFPMLSLKMQMIIKKVKKGENALVTRNFSLFFFNLPKDSAFCINILILCQAPFLD